MACHSWGNPLDRLSHELQLTTDQQAKVQPIIDQTKTQLKSIHETAAQQSKTAMQNAVSQLRPLLTAVQQQKLDAIQKATADMEAAHKEMQAALQQ
jgi:molecular chaperone DnaK (HSP70)